MLDAALTFMRYNLLVFSVQRVTRQMVVEVATDYSNVSDTQLEGRALDTVRTYLSELGFPTGQVSFETPGTGAGQGFEIVKDCSQTPARCFIVMNDVVWTSSNAARSYLGFFTIRTTSKALIDDPCYVCGCP
jgi:hypothetical protein